MTDAEKYFFDLWGYCVVRGALTPEQVTTLNRLTDAKLIEAEALEKSSHRFGSFLGWDTAFRQLIDNPTILPYLQTLIGNGVRLDHDYLDVILKPGLGPIGATLHGGGTPHDPGQFYHFQDGQLINGLTVVAYALKDCNPGDGGFACVPGSHKANFRLPRAWANMADGLAEVVRPVPCRAGDAILFTEALTHGTLPWMSNEQRRTIFLKYTQPMMAWGVHHYDPYAYDDLTQTARKMLEGPNARYGGREGAVD